MRKIYAIIPARGGSKGIPGKNLQKVGGRSLVEIAVTECLDSSCIDEVIVSTDDPEIKLEADKIGAKVMKRPDYLSSDEASSESAIIHVIENLSSLGLETPEYVLFMQATSPFTKSVDINSLCEHLIKSEADSCFSATMFYHFLWKRGENGRMQPINHEISYRPRRQEVDNCLMENGALYAFKTKGFLEHKMRFFGKIEVFEMDENSSFEIDEPLDLEQANFLLKAHGE